MKKNNEHEKILFKYHSNILNETVVETMWAKVVDRQRGLYKLDSIPFYGPLIATDDEFYAEFDKSEERLTYRRTTKHSGNSIVLVRIVEKTFNKEEIRDEFKRLDCTSEGLNDSYFSMEILSKINYKEIKTKLDKYEEEGIIEYAEPCLSSKHLEDINQG